MTATGIASKPDDGDLAQLIHALDNPKRVEILQSMAGHGPDHRIGARAFAEKVGGDFSTYSYHFLVLAGCSAIKQVATADKQITRPHLYSLNFDLPWAFVAFALAQRANDAAATSSEDGET